MRGERASGVPGRGVWRLRGCWALCVLIGALLAPSSAVAAVDALAGTSGCLWKGFVADQHAPDGCASGEVTNYEAIVAAPEGLDVYVADDEGLLRRYARDAATGELTTAAGDCWSDQPLGSCSQLLGIAYPTALALSPDGRHLYVGNGDGIVAVLQRDTATGALTQSG
ncbi:MAG: hypothetical protein JWM90_3096, partial [Thermoleophilia bacterium]|nr:hypothetical protein [Thermoleophilia bacterium]